MTIRIAVFLLMIVAQSGCIHHRTGLPPSANKGETEWTPGVNTRRDVVALWGNPHKTDGSTWIWTERISNGGKVKASYYMIGMTVSNTEIAIREHRLTFDSEGILTGRETRDSIPDGPEWSIWPW